MGGARALARRAVADWDGKEHRCSRLSTDKGRWHRLFDLCARGTSREMAMATRPPPSVLLVRRWAVALLGNLSVRGATTNDGFSVQEAWEGARPAGWTNAHWSWPRILQKHDERFAPRG
jgi:hypothetical protein